LSQPESFFSHPHSLVYTGIFIVISIFFINFRKNISNKNPNKNANFIILLGAVLILSAGPFDFFWHLHFGLDGLLSPPHVTLLSGWMIVGFGNLLITNNSIYLNLKNRRSEKNSSVDRAEINYQDYDRNNHDDLSTVDYTNNLGEKKITLLKFQLFLNLSFILLILSGFIYFFSLPFSETQFYNYNPDPLVAFIVYGLGFPLLLSSFFIRILKNYPEFDNMILLVGTFYVIIMLLTQIVSNPFLSGYSGYYMLNVIPFVMIYLLNNKQRRKKFTKMNVLAPPPPPPPPGNSKKDKAEKYMSSRRYIFYALVLAISSFTICFPLNTYILNEELYGYLLYQNLVSKVYTQLFGDYFIFILGISVIGGLLGLGLEMSPVVTKASWYKVNQLRQYFSEHKHGVD
jgi:hypothetical protein